MRDKNGEVIVVKHIAPTYKPPLYKKELRDRVKKMTTQFQEDVFKRNNQN